MRFCEDIFTACYELIVVTNVNNQGNSKKQ